MGEASARAEPWAERALGGPAAGVAAALGVAMLASWLPQYLTWPWWPDLDAYAAIAQGWDAGRRPYRDVVMFNFPGQVYLLWGLGHLFGWGRTAPAYAADAGLLVALGAALVAWSRRTTGRALPGLVGWAAALAYYLDQDYAMVAQRDWQAPVLAFVGLLMAQARPGRAWRIGSAVLFAVSAVIRPHVVVFGPVAAVVVAQGAPGRRGRALLEWGAAFGLALLAGFAPLIAAGVVGDFVRGVRIAGYGGSYSATTPASVARGAWEQVATWRVGGVLAAVATVPILAGREARRAALPWAVALGLALLYRPLHPKAHQYLIHPLWLARSIALGALTAAVVTWRRLPATARLVAAAGLLAWAVGHWPRFARPERSWESFSLLRRPAEPARVPAGAEAHFAPRRGDAYAWDDYRLVLGHLRARTTPGTLVANVLRNTPFLSLNGPTGRINPFPAESGIIWLWSVEPAREPQYIAALESARDSVVVWVPDEVSFDTRLQLDALAAAIRRLYRPEARYGRIEVWRRRE